MLVAEYTSIVPQTLAVGGSVAFQLEAVKPKGCQIMHRNGSGAVMLRGGAKYLVHFGANVSSATANTQLALALAVDGDVLEATTMNTVSDVADILNNISASAVIAVPCGCCVSVTVENTGTLATTVANANIIVERLED